jgi:hypothetical protein
MPNYFQHPQQGAVTPDLSNLPTVDQKKTEITDYIRLRLGDQIVDVELDREHYELAIKQALIKYRQKAQNAVEESYAFLDLQKEVQQYILPPEVMEVRQIFRRGIGSVTGTTASQFEPFASGYLNTYMLVAGRVGGLTNYELFVHYQELAMKMFGGHMNYTFDRVTKKLTIVRKIPDGGEGVLLWIYNYRPDQVILNDHMIFPWIQEYAYSFAKAILGEARGKFSQIAGPAGGTTLNGDALKQEAQAEMQKLEEDLRNYVTGSDPPTFIIG